jgi:hypothetical protein
MSAHVPTSPVHALKAGDVCSGEPQLLIGISPGT